MSKPPVANSKPNIAAEFERLFGPPPVHKVEDEDSYDAILCGLAHDIGPLDTIECILRRDLGPSVVSRIQAMLRQPSGPTIRSVTGAALAGVADGRCR
jgi:hypothetical protein